MSSPTRPELAANIPTRQQLQQQRWQAHLQVPQARQRSRSPDVNAERDSDKDSGRAESPNDLRRTASSRSQQALPTPEQFDVDGEEVEGDEKQRPAWRRGLAASWVRNKGIFLVLLSQMFGSLMAVTTRLLETPAPGHDDATEEPVMHPFQIIFVRMAITSSCAIAVMWWQKIPDFPFGAKEVRWLLVARGVGGFWGVFGLYWSLQYLPISDAIVMTFLAPMMACWACSKLINEPFTRVERIGALVSIFGVVFIARPASIFASQASPDVAPDVSTRQTHATAPKATPQQRLQAVGMAMVGVCGAVVAYTTIRWIGKRAHPLLSVNYFAFWCTLVSGFFLAFVPSIPFVLPQTTRQWLLLMSIGVSGFIMQYLITAGLRYEKSSRSTNMLYSQMLFALFFDEVIWGNLPDAMSIVGSSLILGSAIVVAIQKESSKKKQVAEEAATAAASASAPVDVERGSIDNDDDNDERAALVGNVDGATQLEMQELRTLRSN